MKKIIIGIHGLKNKPPKTYLENNWIKAIKEGFSVHGFSDLDFDFALVYWADLEYEEPLNPSLKDETHPLYLERPYAPYLPLVQKTDGSIKKKLLDSLESAMDKLYLREEGIEGLEAVTDLAIRKMFADLHVYYHGNCKLKKEVKARDGFRQKLVEVIQKYSNYKIMLIAHSMGSIIAYDTLTQVLPDQKIDTFITVGSPLGLPVIIKKILEEQNIGVSLKSKPKTPESIQNKWLNFSDLDDTVAMNYNLTDDYLPNTKNVKPIDFVINNDYEYNGQKNPHNVYGYLRCNELTQEIFTFLFRRENFLNRICKKLGVK